MHQVLRVCSREKRPQPTCKKGGGRNDLKKKILESMSPASREAHFKKKADEAAQRRNERREARIRAHELRLKDSRRRGKKRRRGKVCKNTGRATKQVVRTKRTPPSQEIIARRIANARWRLIKRHIKKIVAFAERNGVDPVKIIYSLPSSIGTKHFKVSRYQQMALTS